MLEEGGLVAFLPLKEGQGGCALESLIFSETSNRQCVDCQQPSDYTVRSMGLLLVLDCVQVVATIKEKKLCVSLLSAL